MYSDYGTAYAGLIALFAVIGFLFIAVFYVLGSLFYMKIFEKAGVEGKWRAWVPVYNSLIFAKLGDISPWVVLVLIAASFIPVLNYLTGIALSVVFILAAYRVGQKLQKEGAWVVLYIFLSLVWLGINAFDKSRWNTQIPPAAWATQNWLADRTVWDGIPVQAVAQAPGYAAPGYGAAPQGYAPPQGYQPPAAQGYQPPAAPGYQQPAAPGYVPPAAPAAPAAPGTPPAAPTSPPAAPPVPPVTPPAPPAPPVDPTQPPA